MTEWLRVALIDRLHGAHIHVDPMVAVDDLNENDAKRHPLEGGRSPLELLFHMVYWIEFSLDMIGGEHPEYVENVDWDSCESWSSLVERFRKGLSNLEFVAENWELDDEVKISEDLKTCVGAEVMGAIQHTSYHIGQLVTARKALGLWHSP